MLCLSRYLQLSCYVELSSSAFLSHISLSLLAGTAQDQKPSSETLEGSCFTELTENCDFSKKALQLQLMQKAYV